MGADLTTGGGTCAGKKVPFKHTRTRPLIHKHVHALTHSGPLNTPLIENPSADFCPRRADVSGHRVHPGMFARCRGCGTSVLRSVNKPVKPERGKRNEAALASEI